MSRVIEMECEVCHAPQRAQCKFHSYLVNAKNESMKQNVRKRETRQEDIECSHASGKIGRHDEVHGETMCPFDEEQSIKAKRPKPKDNTVYFLTWCKNVPIQLPKNHFLLEMSPLYFKCVFFFKK